MERKLRVCAIVIWIRKFRELGFKYQALVLLFSIVLFAMIIPVKNHVKIKPAPLDNSIAWLGGPSPGVTVYYLKKGDTLYRLSKLYFVSLTELLSINQIENPKHLAEHTKIYIPPVNYAAYNIQEYYLTPGDTSAHARQLLLEKYQLQPWQFQRLNPTFRSSPRFSKDQLARTRVFLPRYPVAINRPGYPNYRVAQLRIIRPVRGMLSSRFGFRWGRMHYGVDLASPAPHPSQHVCGIHPG